jgi:hypothetical protein
VEDAAPDASTKRDEGLTREGAIKKEHPAEFYDGPRDHDRAAGAAEDSMEEGAQEQIGEGAVATAVVSEMEVGVEMQQGDDAGGDQSNGQGDDEMVEAVEGDGVATEPEQTGSSNTME